MHLIIDGYNLIGIFHRNIEKARNDLIDKLVIYNKNKNYNITVVFDAHKYGEKIERIYHKSNITVIFTKVGQSADEAIKSIISEVKKQWIVVSSDRDVVKYAWSMNSIPISSETFYEVLEKTARGNNVVVNDAEKEITDYERTKIKKGNAFRVSRKQKAIERVLSKL